MPLFCFKKSDQEDEGQQQPGEDIYSDVATDSPRVVPTPKSGYSIYLKNCQRISFKIDLANETNLPHQAGIEFYSNNGMDENNFCIE